MDRTSPRCAPSPVNRATHTHAVMFQSLMLSSLLALSNKAGLKGWNLFVYMCTCACTHTQARRHADAHNTCMHLNVCILTHTNTQHTTHNTQHTTHNTQHTAQTLPPLPHTCSNTAGSPDRISLMALPCPISVLDTRFLSTSSTRMIPAVCVLCVGVCVRARARVRACVRACVHVCLVRVYRAARRRRAKDGDPHTTAPETTRSRKTTLIALRPHTPAARRCCRRAAARRQWRGSRRWSHRDASSASRSD